MEHRFTIGTVISYHISWYAICHVAYHCMYLTTPLVLEFPPLPYETVETYQYLVAGVECNSSSSSVIDSLKPLGLLFSHGSHLTDCHAEVLINSCDILVYPLHSRSVRRGEEYMNG